MKKKNENCQYPNCLCPDCKAEIARQIAFTRDQLIEHFRRCGQVNPDPSAIAFTTLSVLLKSIEASEGSGTVTEWLSMILNGDDGPSRLDS